MFFGKKKNENENNGLIKVAALLVHAARIDEIYSSDEQKIIKETLIKFGAKIENVDKILKIAEKTEESSIQILEFTKEIKSMDHGSKVKIIETLWKIIYSNRKADMYETNLMRRLSGLLYIDSNVMADIKERIKRES